MKYLITIGFALISVAAYAYACKKQALPEAIMAKFNELADGGVVTKTEIEKEDGSITYEATIKNKQEVVEIKLDAAGNVIEIEKELSAADLPQAILSALQSSYPDAEIEEAEHVTQGKLTFYEIELETSDDKEFEVKIKSDGIIISTEMDDDDDHHHHHH